MTGRILQCSSSPKDSVGGHARRFCFLIMNRGKGLDNNDRFKNVSVCYKALVSLLLLQLVSLLRQVSTCNYFCLIITTYEELESWACFSSKRYYLAEHLIEPSRALPLEIVSIRNSHKSRVHEAGCIGTDHDQMFCPCLIEHLVGLNHFFLFCSFSHQIMGLHHCQHLPFLRAITKRRCRLVLGRRLSTSLPVSKIFPGRFWAMQFSIFSFWELHLCWCCGVL